MNGPGTGQDPASVAMPEEVRAILRALAGARASHARRSAERLRAYRQLIHELADDLADRDAGSSA